jgi:hypothetical protein
VATAGDVNGDGFDDLLIVALAGFEWLEEGQAYLFLGSASGLASTYTWVANHRQAEGYFVQSAAGAGDLNGDGYADVVIGALVESGIILPNAGNLYSVSVYFGSGQGLGETPDWTVESDQRGDFFGRSVGTAGDVNGDGYSDLIVSAPRYDGATTDGGRVCVFHGSWTGMRRWPDWTVDGDQEDALFGLEAGSAGDVNGDGFTDVVIGAGGYDGDYESQGRCYLFLGSAAGLSPAPQWIAEGHGTYHRFGTSVGTAGDVNGDGFADVVIGETGYTNGQDFEGRAYVYLGTPAGLPGLADWTAEGNIAYAFAGRAVSGAGDVNGDGFADIVVGLPFDPSRPEFGRAHVYYGNATEGYPFAPRQLRANASAPVAYGGMAEETAGFRLALRGHSPLGRCRVKLEWEVKPRGVLFDGADTQQSAAWTDTGTAGVALERLVNGLATYTDYHWRVRLHFDRPAARFLQHTRWLTIPWNGWNEKDLATAPGTPAARWTQYH